MSDGLGWIAAEDRGENLVLRAGGLWTLAATSELDAALKALPTVHAKRATIDIEAVERTRVATPREETTLEQAS